MNGYPVRFLFAILIVGSMLTGVVGIAAAKSAPTVHEKSLAKYGKVLVTPKGMTLYYYTPDTKTASKCTGGCASAWPPLLLPSGMKAPVKPSGLKGTLNTIKRGSRRQVAYNGHPLYTFANDHKSGQATGQGVGGVWFVMKAK